MASNRKLVTSLVFILFLITLIIQVSKVFVIPDGSGKEYLLDKIFLYGMIIIFYLTGAYLLSKLIRLILWKSEFKKKIKPGLIGRLEDIIVTIIYFTSIGFIIIEIKAITVTFLVVLIYLLLLSITIYLRPYIIRLSKTGFIQSVRPFKKGDWIKLHSSSENHYFTGRITGFDIRSVRMRSANDTDLIIPNSRLNSFVVENFTSSGNENRFNVTIGLNQNISADRAKRILRAAAMDALNETFENYKRKPEVLLTTLSGDVNKYSIVYYFTPFEEYSPEEIKDKVLSKVESHLQFAGLSIKGINTEYNILKDLKIFGLLSETDLNNLSASSKKMTHLPGELIIKQGEPGESMFVLEEGLLDVFIEAKDNQKVKVGTLSPGKFFGEMSLFTGEKRGATVVADMESVTLEISKVDIKSILKKKPELVNDFGEVIAEREAINLKKMEEYLESKESFVKKMIESIRLFFNIK
jgi:branched-chain amino acid transport system substrate-binding protein